MDQQVLKGLRKFLCPEIVYGAGAIKLVGRHAANLGGSKVLIVTDPGVETAGWTKRVQHSLREEKIPFAVFHGVTPNPKDHEVMAAADVYRHQRCDLIVAVGGGSPMDCAKGVGIVVGNEGDICDFKGISAVPNPGPPLIFVPTTAGTSADISQFAVITDTSRKAKIAIISKMAIPDISLVDPETTVTMGPALTAATGMDALCHAFEAHVSTASSPLTDMAALNAVALISQNLPGACRYPENPQFRNNMMMASLMAGLAFSNASLGLVHAMAHGLGGGFDLAHGECNALLLEHVVRFNYDRAAGKYAQLAKAFSPAQTVGPGPDAAAILAEAITSFRRKLGIQWRLGDLGVSASDISQLAQHAANDPCLATNPRKAAPKQIEAIFQEIF
jgi:alcohol dehydrogenase